MALGYMIWTLEKDASFRLKTYLSIFLHKYKLFFKQIFLTNIHQNNYETSIEGNLSFNTLNNKKKLIKTLTIK